MPRRHMQITAPAPVQVQLPPRELPVLSVTADEAAEMTRIGRNAILDFIASGKIHTLKIGKKNVIPVKELQRFLDENIA